MELKGKANKSALANVDYEVLFWYLKVEYFSKKNKKYIYKKTKRAKKRKVAYKIN